MSHREEDSGIKTIVDNMHPLVIDGAATNKRLLRFFIHLENKFGYDASNHVKMSTLRQLTCDTPSNMIQDMTHYEDAKNFLMFQLAPDCNQMTLKRELTSITPEVGEEPAAFLSKNKRKVSQMSNNWLMLSPKLVAFGLRGKMHNATISKISTIHPRPFNRRKPIFESALTISVANASGEHATEHHPKEVQIIPTGLGTIFMKVTTPTDSSGTSSQSSELPLGLPALQSSSTISVTTLDMRALNQSTSTTNMVIPSKEIASAALIVSPGIVCWNATGHAFRDPCHICSSVCQIDNLTWSSKTFIHKYASTRAFQIPIKLGAIKAHALINTGAQCSILSSRLVKRALDKQSLQLPKCGKIKVADGTIVNPQGPVVVTMEAAFGEHMIKCVILDDDGND
uniref:Peptidase A2 domain-containing protein n=1 Tax=Romanomermis culicivorax TaxID=13658 RepID=A0A915JH53_ROMCU